MDISEIKYRVAKMAVEKLKAREGDDGLALVLALAELESRGFGVNKKELAGLVTDGISEIDWYHVNKDGQLVPGSESEENAYVKFSDVLDVLKPIGLFEVEE